MADKEAATDGMEMTPDEAREIMREADEVLTRFDEIYARIARAHGITYNTMVILTMAYDSDAVTQAQVCEETFLPKSSVHSMVKKLMEQGLLSLEGGRNKKEKNIVLTPKGRAFAGPIDAETRRIESAALRSVSLQDARRFIALSQATVRRMEQEADALYGDR